jgi:hypothetical protein
MPAQTYNDESSRESFHPANSSTCVAACSSNPDLANRLLTSRSVVFYQDFRDACIGQELIQV